VTYRLTVTATAQRQLDALPDRVAFAVYEFMLGRLLDNPQVAGGPLRWEWEGCHAARVGDYRIIYEIHDDQVTVDVLRVAHRARAYRPR
jgi:addiction module RelE/StbE family toxin